MDGGFVGLLFLVFLPALPRHPFQPLDHHVGVAADAVAVPVHFHQLPHCRQIFLFRCAGDQLDSAVAVGLDVDAVEVRQTDEEVVLRVVVVFRDGDAAEQRQHTLPELLPIRDGDRLGNAVVHLAQLVMIRRHHLGGQDALAHVVRHRVLDIQDIVDLVDQIRGDGEGEQLALFQRLADRFVEVLARGEVLVVPDRDIAAARVGVDQLHQLLRVLPVLFAVAHEDVRVKGGAHLLCQLVADDDRLEVFRQLLAVGQRGGVGIVFVEVLQIAEFGFEQRVKIALPHQRQDGDMVRQRKGYVKAHRAVGRRQQRGRDRHDKELHLAEQHPVVRDVVGLCGGVVDPVDGAVLPLQDIPFDFGEARAVLRMTGEVHTLLAPRDAAAARKDLKFRHGHAS